MTVKSFIFLSVIQPKLLVIGDNEDLKMIIIKTWYIKYLLLLNELL